MALNITFNNDITEISRLAGFIDEVAEKFSLPMDMVFSLNLVLEEAVTNVIMYAYPKEEHEFIYLSADICSSGSIILRGKVVQVFQVMARSKALRWSQEQQREASSA